MSHQVVTLNSKDYLVLPDKQGRAVRRRELPQFAGAQRTEGRRDITSISNREEYAFRSPIRGMGKTRIEDAGDPKEFQYCADSTALTRYPTGVYAATLSNTATAPSNPTNVTLGACKAIVGAGTTAYGFWTGVYNDGGGDERGRLYRYQYSAQSWNSAATLVFNTTLDANTNTHVVVHAAAAVGTTPLVLFTARDTTAGTWNTFLYSNTSNVLEVISTQTLTASDTNDLNGGAILVDGATVWVAVGYTTFLGIYKSTDSGATFGAVFGTVTTGYAGCTGLALYEDNTGTVRLMIGTPVGVYAMNTSTGAAAIVPGLDFRNYPNTYNCRGMAEKQGALYVPLGAGYGRYVKYTWDGNAAHVEYVGPASLGGLPTARQGAITAVCEADKWLLWAAGGLAASKQASVFSWDPVYDALHSEWTNGTANRRIDAIAVVNNILHVSERTAANTTVMRYHNNFLDDPSIVTTTVAHEDGSYVAWPQFDGGFASDNASWEDLAVECDGLTATAHATSGAWLLPTYDADGSGSYVDTGLSDSAGASATTMLSGRKKLYWGSALGLSAVTMQPKLTFKRGTTNTLTARSHTLMLGFKKRRAVKYQYEFLVDIVETAKRRGTTVTALASELTNLLPSTQIVKVALAYGLSETTPANRRVTGNVYVNAVDFEDYAGGGEAEPVSAGVARVLVAEG